MKRVAIYLRVSTDKQTTDNQRRELEAVAARSGWHVVRCMRTPASAEPKGRDKRPGLDAMLKAVNARELNMVAAWSVDRLGTSKDSIPRPAQARRCSRCLAYLPSLSAV